MSNAIHRGAIQILSDVSLFSRMVVGLPLRGYQVRPLRPVIQSILRRQGREFLLVFPRQSGKNEAVAQLLVYLMNLLQRVGGQIVYGATGDAGLAMARLRLESRLDNPWNRTQWTKQAGMARSLGRCQVLFLSTHPLAASRGQTARWLLVIDETQDQVGSHIEAVFTPMRAAYNATALYIGTVKTTSDYLWQKKRELEAEEQADGQQRVFFAGPHQVAREVPAYGQFLEDQVRRHGRHHPIVASEYFLEPIDASGGLFPPERRLLMRGFHRRANGPVPGRLYVATVDVAGEDEAPTDPLVQLRRPGRDYTVATVFEVDFGAQVRGSDLRGNGAPAARAADPVGVLPVFRAADVFVDHGSKHFCSPDPLAAGSLTPGPSPQRLPHPQPLSQRLPAAGRGGQEARCAPGGGGEEEVHGAPGMGVPGGAEGAGAGGGEAGEPAGGGAAGASWPAQPSLAGRLRSWLEGWGVAHVVADASGVGQGLVSWLQAALGSQRVTAFHFTPRSKAALGSAFVALVETGRFRYWTGDEDQMLADGWWFWRQVEACGYELRPGGQFDCELRWEVPPGHRTDTPAGLQPTHDDRLVSAALVAEVDRLYRTGKLRLGLARSSLVEGADPLGGGVY